MSEEEIFGDSAFLSKSNYGLHPENTFAGVTSFFRRRYSRDLNGVDVAITGVPVDTATSGRPGTRFGPRAIREASSQIAWERPYDWDFNMFDELAMVDYGDVSFDHGRLEEMPGEIRNHIKNILDQDTATLTLGGDHFITYPVLQAHAEKHGPLSLIHFDAHSDTWSNEDEDGRVDHGTMFYQAAKEGIIIPEKSVQIGLRTTNPDTLGFNILDARWVSKHGPEACAAEIKRIVGNDKAYITFDIDCLDPAFAPGTGTPVFGGVTSPDMMILLRNLAGVNVVGMDVVEVSPPYDHADITALAGATIAAELLAIYSYNKLDK
ncbi:agmatinase [Curvivirga aplysinae]|uniref:agmatinase n=1 Tax=Curvivirga aplysinae TaxID=2529852 RepID=UPI0012BB9358|nr:agmatinase [Curvivirga aplysinae]MTI09425.1 agmatinase [Curvivirga aplysinae]